GPAAPLWLDRAPSAEIDLVQLAWVTAALFGLLHASEDGLTPWRRYLRWQAALLCVAGGLLTKWTAPAFFYLTALPFLFLQARLRLLAGWPHLAAVALAALPCLGWLALVAHEVGLATLIDTVRREALLRLSPGHHPRPYPWGELITFPLSVFAGSLPWSLCALWTL